MNKRTLIILGLILLTAIALPLAVYLVQQQQQLRGRAAPATTLCFSTTSSCATTVQGTVGTQLTIDVLMNTNQNTVTSAELYATIQDPTLFQIPPSISQGTALPNALVAGSYSASVLSITVGASPTSPVQSNTVGAQIARMTLFPVRAGSTIIDFGGNTRIAGTQEGSNVLSSSQSVSISIGGGPTTAPTPIPTTAPTAGPTPVPTTAPTAGPTPVPTLGPGACTDTKPAGSPTLTSVTAGTNSATLVWTAATDPVTHYGVVYGLAPGEERFGALNVGNKNIRTFTVNNLAGGTTYYFRVKAFNGCAQGNPSNEVSATPTGGQVTVTPTGFVPITPAPTPTTFIGGGPSPTPVSGVQPIPEAGIVTPTTIFLGVGTFLLLLGGVLLFL